MELYHCSPAFRRETIEAEGLLVRYHRGKIPAVWLASARWMHWAWMHVALIHDIPTNAVVCFPIDVPRGWLTYRRRGIWLCKRDIETDRIGEALVYADIFSGRS